MTSSDVYKPKLEKGKDNKEKEKDEPAAPHKFSEVIAAWEAVRPRPAADLILYYHSNKKYGGNSKFDATFNHCYEVELDGWRYIVQAHVHVTMKTGGSGQPDYGGGNTFVAGFGDQSVTTPVWVTMNAPTFVSGTHVDDWSSDPTYRATLFSDVTGYRYPTKL